MKNRNVLEVREMIDDAIEKHEIEHLNKCHHREVHGNEAFAENIPLPASYDYQQWLAGKDRKSSTIWKLGWLAWEGSYIVSIEELYKLYATVWIPRIGCRRVMPISYLSIPTDEQLAGEIDGVKVIVTENLWGTITVCSKEGLKCWFNDFGFAKTFCKKFHLFLLTNQQIQEQYGGIEPTLRTK